MNPRSPLMDRNWVLIDAAARTGFQLVRDGGLFAIARWNGAEFEHGSGRPAGFEPTHYWLPRASREGHNHG